MTPEEKTHLQEQLDEMQAQQRQIHSYLFVPPVHGRETRAAELDDVLTGVRFGKITSRMVLWLAGFIAALAAMWEPILRIFR